MNITKTDLEFLFSYINKPEFIYDLSGALKRIASSSKFNDTEEVRKTLLQAGNSIEETKYNFENLEDVLSDVKNDLHNILTPNQMSYLLKNVILINHKDLKYKEKTNIIEYFIQNNEIQYQIFDTLSEHTKDLVVMNLWVKETYKEQSKDPNNNFNIPKWLDDISTSYLESFINDKRFSNKMFFKLLEKAQPEDLKKFINKYETVLQDSEYFFQLKENVLSDNKDNVPFKYETRNKVIIENKITFNFAELFYKKNILSEKEKNNFYEYVNGYVFYKTKSSMAERNETTPKNTIFFIFKNETLFSEENAKDPEYKPYLNMYSSYHSKKSIYETMEHIYKLCDVPQFKEFLQSYYIEEDRYREQLNSDLFEKMDNYYKKHIELIAATERKEIILDLMSQHEPNNTDSNIETTNNVFKI